MKVKKNKLSSIAAGMGLLLAALFSCPASKVSAQGYYALTNGSLKWYLNAISDRSNAEERSISQIALPDTVDPLGNPVWVDYLPTPYADTTLNLYAGNLYVKLDISNPTNPVLSTTSVFDPYCAWRNREEYRGTNTA